MSIHKGQYTCICQAKGQKERMAASGTSVLWVGCLSQNLHFLGLLMLRNLYLDLESHPSSSFVLRSQKTAKE